MKDHTLLKSFALFLSWLTLSPLLLILDGHWKLLPKWLRIVLFVFSLYHINGIHNFAQPKSLRTLGPGVAIAASKAFGSWVPKIQTVFGRLV